MFNTSFFRHVELLREKHHTDFQFNLFSVLRSESDEVRLHSRFIAEILNPKGSHGFGSYFLGELLKLIGMKLKSLDSAVVFTKYENIDTDLRDCSFFAGGITKFCFYTLSI